MLDRLRAEHEGIGLALAFLTEHADQLPTDLWPPYVAGASDDATVQIMCTDREQYDAVVRIIRCDNNVLGIHGTRTYDDGAAYDDITIRFGNVRLVAWLRTAEPTAEAA